MRDHMSLRSAEKYFLSLNPSFVNNFNILILDRTYKSKIILLYYNCPEFSFQTLNV